MELTRRDALIAAVGTGVGVGGGGIALSITHSKPGGEASESAAATGKKEGAEEELAAAFGAVARAIYPEKVEGIEGFVRTYVTNRFDPSGGKADSRRATTLEVVRELDELAANWHDASVTDLDVGAVETLLREIGTDVADPDPSGTFAQRLRFYVVNELQYALYTSPTGGTLVGIENPIGYPGGTASYRRGPSA